MSDEGYERATEQSLADLERAIVLLGDYPTAFGGTLEQARLLKSVFKAWLRMGKLALDFLNRTGGPETLRLAREINRIGKDL